MTPPDPKTTAPPTVAPASDQEIAEFFDLLQSFGCDSVNGKLMARCSVCFGPWFDPEDPASPILHDRGCATVTGPSIKARIEQDRAEVSRLRARVAELEEALSKVENGIFDLASDSPICQLHRLKLSALVDFIRAALKPEPR